MENKMKKIIASLALVLLFFGTALAQNNTANVTQSGSEAVTTVTQTGSTNTVTATEHGWLNYANFDQLGNNNTASVLSNAGVGASGSNNSVKWLITHDFIVPNTLIVPSVLGDMHGDGITQHGNTNGASVTQTGDYNIAGVGQIGSNDQVTIAQTAAFFGGQNWAAVDQLTGNSNVATLSQSGTDIQGYIRQNGGSNNASVTQNNYNVFSEVVQEGSNNVLTQTVTASAVPWDGTFASAKAYQIGNANYAIQLQSGVNNTSLVTTIGNNNGILGDEVKTDQTGNDNTATVEMGLLAAVSLNLASIVQTGNSNLATISIEGGNANTARISQDRKSVV